MAKEAATIPWRVARRPDNEFEDTALVHLDALYRLGLRLTHHRAEVEDLVQETYLRAFKNFHRFNPGTNCLAWLFTILRHLFLNQSLLECADRLRTERMKETRL